MHNHKRGRFNGEKFNLFCKNAEAYQKHTAQMNKTK
jgi:hypothetical protein